MVRHGKSQSGRWVRLYWSDSEWGTYCFNGTQVPSACACRTGLLHWGDLRW